MTTLVMRYPSRMVYSYGLKNECLSHSVDRYSMALLYNEPMSIDIPKIVFWL